MDPLTISKREVTSSIDEPRHDTPQSENFIVEIIKYSILAIFIVIPFRVFIAQPFLVNGASMSPTFETGQYLIVDQLSYRFEGPHRGDVVVFRYPNDPSKFFIKRLIGLPGEVVQLSHGRTSILNPSTGTETTLSEPYVKTDPTDDNITVTLSGDEYFVMGDNRGASSDSRVWGPVPSKNIVGRAFLRILPPGLFAVLPGSYVQPDSVPVSVQTR